MDFFRKQPEAIGFKEFMDKSYKLKDLKKQTFKTMVPSGFSGFSLTYADIGFLTVAGTIVVFAVVEKHLADKGYLTIAESINKILGTALPFLLIGGAGVLVFYVSKIFL